MSALQRIAVLSGLLQYRISIGCSLLTWFRMIAVCGVCAICMSQSETSFAEKAPLQQPAGQASGSGFPEHEPVEIKETFMAGSKGNGLSFRVVNTTAHPIEGLSLRPSLPAQWMALDKIEPAWADLKPGEEIEFVVEFSVDEDAPDGDEDVINFHFFSPSPLPIPISRYKLIATIKVDEKQTANAEIHVCTLSDDAPSNLQYENTENAFNFCDLERKPNEYDKIAVFFTPQQDLREPIKDRDPFLYQIIGPNGDRILYAPFDPSQIEASGSPLAKEGSPGRVVAILDLWDPSDAKEPSEASRGPGTYSVQTVKGEGTGNSAFGQSDRHIVPFVKELDDGSFEQEEWLDEGTFDIISSRLHFQGFVTEHVKNVRLPVRDDLLEGELTLEDPEINNSSVMLKAEAWWKKAKKDSQGQRTEDTTIHRAESMLTIDFPEQIAPGHQEMGEIKVVMKPTQWGDYFFTAGMHLMIPSTTEPPGRDLVEGASLPTAWAYADFLEDECLSSTPLSYIKNYVAKKDQIWFWPRGSYKTEWPCMASETTELDGSMILLAGKQERLSGNPERRLPAHLHNAATRWYIPVFITLTDNQWPGKRSLEMKSYGYAIYAVEPGTYTGPLPEGGPETGGGPPDDISITDQGPEETGGEEEVTAAEGDNAQANEQEGPGSGEGEKTDGGGGISKPDIPTPPIPGVEKVSPITVDTVNPLDRDAAGHIRDWMANARPPINAVPGANVRYSPRGNKVGTVPGETLRSSHDEGKPIDPVFLWKNKRSLDSVDHCTMEEYVVAKLNNDDESISHCKGRYGGVGDLAGEQLPAGKTAVESAGFKPSISIGSPAKSPEAEGTIEKQEPDWTEPLKKGETVTLVVHSPYVPPGSVLPDFIGKSVKEASDWLKDNNFEVGVKPGGMAPSQDLSNAVKEQKPEAGTKVIKGAKVVLTVYAPFVDIREVPDVVGLSARDAQTRLAAAGFKTEPRGGTPASNKDESGTVESQKPAPYTKMEAGGTVKILIHPEYVDIREVPKVEGLSARDAQTRLAAAGFKTEPRGGTPASNRDESGTVESQKPAPYTKMEAGGTVEIFIVYEPVEEIIPGQRFKTIIVPDVNGLTASKAKQRISDADLKPEFHPGGEPSTANQEGMVERQNPAPGTRTGSGAKVDIYVYGAYVPKTLPPAQGQKTKKDYCNCEIDTSLMDGDNEWCGLYREPKNQAGEHDPYGRDLIYHIVNNALERSGSWKKPDGWDHSTYNTCAEFLKIITCEGFCPEDERDGTKLTVKTIVGYWYFTGESSEISTKVDGYVEFFEDGSFYLEAANKQTSGDIDREEGKGTWELVGNQLTFGGEGGARHKGNIEGDPSAFTMHDEARWTLRFKKTSRTGGGLTSPDGSVEDDPIDSVHTFGQ